MSKRRKLIALLLAGTILSADAGISLSAAVIKEAAENIAIATVTDYVNLRAEPTTESEAVGKLYANAAATVLETVTDEAGEAWHKINSGSVENAYVKAEFVSVGDEERIRQAGTRYATVKTTTLFVRKEPGTDSPVIGMLPDGDDVKVLEERDDGWLKVSVENKESYISGDYTELWTDYAQAESKAEEEARLAREEAERKAAEKAEGRTKEQGVKKESAKASGSSKGQAVVNYASQFVGNPYVYGGSSLTNGADCSGFVMSVYAAFGVSLPHSSRALRNVGYGVSMDQIQPGDIVCYNGHVGLYAGNNTLLHASSPRSGIKYTSPITYREILAIRRIF